uniref:Uncharacterized protein n=1 Tax=Lotus japonicus TaxID=34305 RepID=I3SSI7_LOTJA|nr:unknown [Lotus japonicus]
MMRAHHRAKKENKLINYNTRI